MATYKPGAIVDGVAGSIGGTVWRDAGILKTIQGRTKPTEKYSNHFSESKNMTVRAAQSWAALGDTERAQWETVGALIGRGYRWGKRVAMSGYQAYFRSWRLQQGRAAISAPVVPSIAEYPDDLGMVTEDYGVDLWLMGYDRDLGGNETIIHRVMRESSTANMSWKRKIHRYIEVKSGGWLGATVGRSQRYNGASTSATYVGAIDAGAVHTIEMWVKFDEAQTWSLVDLVRIDDTDIVIHPSYQGKYQIRNGAAYQVVGDPILDGAWHYITHTLVAGAGGLISYKDGLAWGDPLVGTAVGFGTYIRIGYHATLDRWMLGCVDSIRISDVVRTPEEVAANWNDGIGRPFVADANTKALWRFNAVVGDQVEDVSGNGRHLDVVDMADAPGVGSRLVYAGAESAMTSRRGVPIETVCYDTDRLLRCPRDQVVAWP